jgi:hypothetical protein
VFFDFFVLLCLCIITTTFFSSQVLGTVRAGQSWLQNLRQKAQEKAKKLRKKHQKHQQQLNKKTATNARPSAPLSSSPAGGAGGSTSTSTTTTPTTTTITTTAVTAAAATAVPNVAPALSFGNLAALVSLALEFVQLATFPFQDTSSSSSSSSQGASSNDSAANNGNGDDYGSSSGGGFSSPHWLSKLHGLVYLVDLEVGPSFRQCCSVLCSAAAVIVFRLLLFCC